MRYVVDASHYLITDAPGGSGDREPPRSRAADASGGLLIHMNVYPGERIAFAELVSIVRREVQFDDRWAIVDWIRREMHAASPDQILGLLDRAGHEVASDASGLELRSVLERVDALRERTRELVWEQATGGQSAPHELVEAMHEMIRAVDPALVAHLQGVGALAGRIARDLGLEGDDVVAVTIAGTLADAGKLKIPQELLQQTMPLDPASFGLLREHAMLGERMVTAIPGLRRYAPLVRSHHERLDGSGYPDKKRGDEISLEVRILGVADVFDAMVSSRPYRTPHTPREAIEHLAINAGQLYDPFVVHSLERVLRGRRPQRGDSTAA